MICLITNDFDKKGGETRPLYPVYTVAAAAQGASLLKKKEPKVGQLHYNWLETSEGFRARCRDSMRKGVKDTRQSSKAHYEVALSLLGSPGRPINRELGPPDNCPLPLVMVALFVGCLPLAAVAAVER